MIIYKRLYKLYKCLYNYSFCFSFKQKAPHNAELFHFSHVRLTILRLQPKQLFYYPALQQIRFQLYNYQNLFLFSAP